MKLQRERGQNPPRVSIVVETADFLQRSATFRNQFLGFKHKRQRSPCVLSCLHTVRVRITMAARKHYDPKQCGDDVTFTSKSRCTEESLGRNSKRTGTGRQELTQRPLWVLPTWLPTNGCIACFTVASAGVVPRTMGESSSPQSLTNKMPHSSGCTPASMVSTDVPSSQLTLACVKLTQN